jgi:hypothetical protein
MRSNGKDSKENCRKTPLIESKMPNCQFPPIHKIKCTFHGFKQLHHLSEYKFATSLRDCFRESLRRMRTPNPKTKVIAPKMNVKVLGTLPREKIQLYKSMMHIMWISSSNTIVVAIETGFSLSGNNSPFKISAIGLKPIPSENSRGMKNSIGVQMYND